MSTAERILVIDPIPFHGGSKTATQNMLALAASNPARITVLSSDPACWRARGYRCTRLREPRWLTRREQSIAYFLRHSIIALNLLLARLRHGKFDIAVGASGPGVDLALYLARPLLGYRILQLVHGPVAASRTNARSLLAADRVFYLESARDSLFAALQTRHSRDDARRLLEAGRFRVFSNGLPAAAWPSPRRVGAAALLWAASLLKWKGLDLLLDALRGLPADERPQTHICYIRPGATNLAVSAAPVALERVDWHEKPPRLDTIRAGCGIFVSTSEREPFGLSILEAMAAGLAVVLPADGAYWDQRLVDGRNCLKYVPGNATDLAQKISRLSRSPRLVETLGAGAKAVAQDYRSERVYAEFAAALRADDGARGASAHSALEAGHAEAD